MTPSHRLTSRSPKALRPLRTDQRCAGDLKNDVSQRPSWRSPSRLSSGYHGLDGATLMINARGTPCGNLCALRSVVSRTPTEIRASGLNEHWNAERRTQCGKVARVSPASGPQPIVAPIIGAVIAGASYPVIAGAKPSAVDMGVANNPNVSTAATATEQHRVTTSECRDSGCDVQVSGITLTVFVMAAARARHAGRAAASTPLAAAPTGRSASAGSIARSGTSRHQTSWPSRAFETADGRGSALLVSTVMGLIGPSRRHGSMGESPAPRRARTDRTAVPGDSAPSEMRLGSSGPPPPQRAGPSTCVERHSRGSIHHAWDC